MKKIMMNEIFRCRIKASFLILSALFLVCITSCASSKASGNSFYTDNIVDFRSEKLSNGIPVYFKQNRGSKVCVLRMIVEGGVSFYSKAQDGTVIDGIEDFAFELSQHGSKNFSYEDIQNLTFEKSFSLTSSSNKDYTVAGFTCISRDVNLVTDVFADSILNPLMEQEDFDKLYKDAQVLISQKKADPSGALGIELSKLAFKNHPYSVSASVQEESFSKLNLETVKNHFESLLVPSRIKFVVVADMNVDETKELVSRLNGYFGSLQKKNWSPIAIPSFSFTPETVYLENEQAGESGYITGIFASPDKTSPDYIPFAIGLMYLDDIFFDQIREKAGAVYSMGTGVLGGRHFYGAVSAYKANNSKNLKELLVQAVDSISDKEIEERLDQYKNKYITTIFSSSQNASGIAANIVSSLEYYGSESAYLKRPDMVQKVTAKQVSEACNNYVKKITQNDSAAWVVVSGKDTVKTFGF